MAYPSSIDSFTNPSGTSQVSVVDHALQHTNANNAIVAIETVVGTTSGTSILRSFTAGQFPPRMNGSNVLQHALSGTINSSVLGTPAITGGTVNTAVLGTPTLTLGSDAQGDMFYRSSAGTVTRVGIGTNGQYLTTNGTTPSWGTVSTSTTALARAYNGTAQSVSSGSVTKINLDTENFDPGSNFATSTFTVPTTGYYQAAGGVQFISISTGKLIQVYLTRNGTIVTRNSTTTGVSGQAVSTQVSDLLSLTAGDTVQLKGEHNEGTALSTSAASDSTFFAIVFRTT